MSHFSSRVTSSLVAGVAVLTLAGFSTACSSSTDRAVASADAAASSVQSAASSAAAAAQSTLDGAASQVQSAVESANRLPSVTAVPTPSVPGVVDVDLGGDVTVDVEIGDCVEAGGTLSDAHVSPVDCGSPTSNYRVIGKAPTNAECVADADTTYYEEALIGGEQGALCMDVDWTIGSCMDVSGDTATRVDCADLSKPRELAVSVLTDTADATACPDGGYAHGVRNFVVCTQSLTE